MTSSTLRAFATALLLTAGIAGVAAVSTTVVAEAAGGVRPQVGRALQDAIHDAESGNGSAAMAKIREAEGAGSLTSGEQQASSRPSSMSGPAGQGGGATGCKTVCQRLRRRALQRRRRRGCRMPAQGRAYEGESPSSWPRPIT